MTILEMEFSRKMIEIHFRIQKKRKLYSSLLIDLSHLLGNLEVVVSGG